MKKYLSKFLYLMLVIAMVFSLGACAEKPKDKKVETPASEVNTKPSDTISSEAKDKTETNQEKQEKEDSKDNTSAKDSVSKNDNSKDNNSENSSSKGNILKEIIFSDTLSEDNASKDDVQNEDASNKETNINPESKVAEFVQDNGVLITSLLEAELASKNVPAICEVVAVGTRIVITCKLTGYNNLSDAEKSKIQISQDTLNTTANSGLLKIKEIEPAISGADINICEENGAVITTVSTNK